MEVQQVNPSSWQPLLCAALFDELEPLCSEADASKLFAYLTNRRGVGILEILATAQWKSLSNAHEFLRMLSKAWKSIYGHFIRNGGDESPSEIDLREFDVLLPNCEDLVPGGNNIVDAHCDRCRCGPSRHDASTEERRGRVQRMKGKDLEKRRKSRVPVLTSTSSDDEDKFQSDYQVAKYSKQRRRYSSSDKKVLLVCPAVQEDSDGFPACWCDNALSTTLEGARMNVDDIVLPMIRAALPRKLKLEGDEPAVILVLLACLIRKSLPFQSDASSMLRFVDTFLATCSIDSLCILPLGYEGSVQEDSDDRGKSAGSIFALKKELLIYRHGVRALVSTLTCALANGKNASPEVFIRSSRFLLDNLRVIRQSLTAAPRALDYFVLLGVERCMEYLLEMAADLVIGILRITVDVASLACNQLDGNNREVSSAVSILLDLSKENYLDDMVRDVCIGLDLLATMDLTGVTGLLDESAERSHRRQISVENEFARRPEPQKAVERTRSLDSVYHGKLYGILVHIVAVVNILQRLRSTNGHLSSCSKSNHRLCCVTCLARHHTESSEFRIVLHQDQISSSFSSRSNKCSIAYMEKMVFTCLKNVTGWESKQMCIEALESISSCCCVSEVLLLTTLLELLAEFSSYGQRRDLLLKCFTAKLTRQDSCGKSTTWQCQFCGYSRDEEGGSRRLDASAFSEDDSLSLAWTRFESEMPSDGLDTVVLELLWHASSSSPSFKDEVARAVLIPSLAKWCQGHLVSLKSPQIPFPGPDLRLYSSLVHLCQISVQLTPGYRCVVERIFPYSDLLFDHPDTREAFVRFARQLAMLEWDVAGRGNSIYVVNRFLFNKYFIIGKLILNDTMNFVSDTAREFLMTSAILMDTCTILLACSSNGFRLIFNDSGGYTHTCRIIEMTAQHLFLAESPTKSEVDENSGHRMAQLLADAVGVCLGSGSSEEKMSKAFDPLRSLTRRVETNGPNKSLVIFLARRLLDAALRSCDYKNGEDVSNASQQHFQDELSLDTSLGHDTKDKWIIDTGYDADVESALDTNEAYESNDHSDSPQALERRRSQSKLCVLSLELLRGMLGSCTDELSSSNDAASALLLSTLHGYCSKHTSFTKLLIDEDFNGTLQRLAEVARDHCLQASLKLFFHLFKLNPHAVDLTPVMRRFSDRGDDFQDFVIECFTTIIAETPFEPSTYLAFPKRVAVEGSESTKRSSKSRSRSNSPKKVLSTAFSMGAQKQSGSRKTSASSATSSSPFGPLLSGLSSIFSFGGITSGKHFKSSTSGDDSPTDKEALGKGTSPEKGALDPFNTCPDSAIAFSLDDTTNYSLFSGLSICLWAYFDNSTEMDQPLHLVTVGDGGLSCSMYFQRSRKSILVKLFSSGLAVAEFSRRRFAPLEKWTHLLLVVVLEGEQLTIKVCCDGARQVIWSNDLRWCSSKRSPLNTKDGKYVSVPYVCLGSTTRKPGTGRGYRLGTVAGFRGELSLEHSIVLRSLGPRCLSVCDTKSRRLDSDLASFINGSLLFSREKELKIGALLEDRLGLMEQLQKCQAFAFSPSNSDQVIVYPDTMVSSGSGVGSNDADPYRRVPVAKTYHKQATIECCRNFTIDDALASLGGVKLFMYLFARSVECERPDQLQAYAMRLVLETASRNPEWWRVFIDLRGYVVVSRILSSNYCRPGFKLLKVIFDFALSVDVIKWPLIKHDNSSMTDWKPELVNVESAVIQDPFAITCFLLDPEIWKENSVMVVWETALEAIRRLMTETQPIVAAFNICQLNKAKFLKCLFFFLTERLQDPLIHLSPNMAFTVSNIALHLIGSPPNVLELTVCWDFLFLTHPASSTYLNYRISGPSEWLDPDLFVEPLVHLDNYESKLGTKLRQIMNSTGKSAFLKWIASDDWYTKSPSSDDVSSNKVPSLVVETVTTRPSSDTEPVAEGQIQQPQHLPDLVCDIDTNVAAGEMSDSMRTVKSTSGTDDEVFPGDEFVDARSDVSRGSGQRGKRDEMDAMWLLEIRRGLLGVLCHVLTNSPDVIVHRIIGSVVKWEHLLVMLRRQSDPTVRIFCIKALCVLLKRATADQRSQFLKVNGFALLANQLREYPCHEETVNDLFGLLCDNVLDSTQLSSLVVDRFQAGVIKPLLVAYQNSLDDMALFWNMSTAFCRIFQSNGVLAQSMLESHLGEVLANVLLQLSLRHNREIDISGMTEGSLLMDGWRSLASVVLHRCLTQSNIQHHQAFSELLQLIHCAAVATSKLGNEAHTLVRKELSFLIHLALESTRQLYDDVGSVASGGGPFPVLFANTSSQASTPLQSGRETPLQFGELPSPTIPNAFLSSGRTRKPTLPSIGAVPAVAVKRRSSLSGSFTSLKERLFSISHGNLSQVLSPTDTSEKLATQSEILDKWKMLLQYSVEYFIFFSANDSMEERHLFDYLLHFAISTLASESSGGRKRGNTWQSLMWSSRAKLQQFLSHSLIFLFFPAEMNYSKLLKPGARRSMTLQQDLAGEWFRRRLLMAEAWAHEPQAKTLLKFVLDSIPECQGVVTGSVYELLLCDYGLADTGSMNWQKLLKVLGHAKVKSPFDEYDNADEIVHNVCWDERTTLEIYIGLRAKWFERMKNFATRLRNRSQNLAKGLSNDAMAITCTVVGEQNVPRKLFIQMKKQAADDSLVAEEVLRSIATDLCHPAGPCFHVSSWPANWCLSPTEGPHRERRRLMPAHLDVQTRFLLPERRKTVAFTSETRPLVKLLSGLSPDNVAVSTIAGQLLERLRIEDKIIFNCSAVVIRTSYECDGELLIGDRALYFVGETSRSSQKGLPLDSVISMNWPYRSITAFHRRYFHLMDLALEIFFADGETYMISFETKEKRELFVSRLSSMDLPNLSMYSDHLLQTLTAWWREGNITNFQYLMQLNTLSGRTFNDLMQYPVFPFVLSDYSSMTLNLDSPIVYRNLAKPIAIQDLQMESHYVQVYRSLESDMRRNAAHLSLADSMPLIGAYHYGSHYSNSGIVAHYLVRLPPFTQLVLEYQDNNFDLPDRTFHSISTAYRLSTSESTTDFKELIPEFFFLSEFLTNREGLNFGNRQNGQSISDVELPPWCPNSDPRLFILIHRQALESAFVSANLHQWVDLIFGYKQTGQAAIDAVNVFHPATYHGTLVDAADSDEIRLKALNTMVKTYGQMPKQLYKTPHLPHLIAQNYLAITNKVMPQSPILSVNGIRWGHYVGSPELPDPSLVLKQRFHGGVSVKPILLTALADGSCVGCPSKSLPLVLYGPVKKDLWLANVREVEHMFILSWDFGDKIARIRSLFPPDTLSANWTNAIALHDDEVTSYSNCPGSPMVMFGLKTGVVLVYKLELDSDGLRSCTLVRSLYGHRSSITAIDVCYEYSVFVTGSEDGECFVWDFNKLNFVLALRKHCGAVTNVCISKTSCEVATVALKGWGSELVLHTINGRVLGSIETDIVITSVTMSSASEGTAVNCIAAGMQNGLIRLWNMWTLAPIREIYHPHFLEPFTSLSYSHNSLKLYACTRSGAVLCWDSGGSKQVRPPRFFCLNPFH